MDVNKREFDPLLGDLMKNLNQHIEEEEVISILSQLLTVERRLAEAGIGHRQGGL